MSRTSFQSISMPLWLICALLLAAAPRASLRQEPPAPSLPKATGDLLVAVQKYSALLTDARVLPKLSPRSGKTFSSSDVSLSPAESRKSRDDVVKETTCRVDAVVVGRPSSPTAFVDPDEKIIFTGYQIQVDRAFRGNLPKKVTYVRPGGALQQPYKVESNFNLYPALELGKTYVLFLIRAADDTYVTLEGPRGIDVLLVDATGRARRSESSVPHQLNQSIHTDDLAVLVDRAGCK